MKDRTPSILVIFGKLMMMVFFFVMIFVGCCVEVFVWLDVWVQTP
jgi:hypothetical protein